MLTEEEVIRAIEPVVDPEIGISIVGLGLVYGATINDGDVKVEMTLTSPWCPAGPMLISQVQQAVAALPDVNNVDVEIVWSPPWDPRTMANDEVKEMLGFY
jgi:metal-sulfur cluster biosynthetic enzyme